MLSEKEYRDIPLDSYSSIKDFLYDRKKYYRKHILHEKVKEKESDSMVLGSLVDQLLSDPDNLEEKFEVAMSNKPTGQMLTFCDELYRLTLEATDMNGVVTKPIDSLMEEAFDNVKYDRDGNEVAFKKKDISYVIDRFTGTNAEEYYNQLRRSTVKYIINKSDLEAANNIIDGLRGSQFTGAIVRQQTTGTVEVLYQLKIQFELEGYPLKAMLDKVIINHKSETISEYDYKITWNVEDFESTFRKLKYHLQASLYRIAIEKWAEEQGYKGYKIDFVRFIVADSINYMSPLIYETDEVLFNEGLNGYINIYGEYIPGVLYALEQIAWHKEKDLWNISRENYENNGRVKIKSLASEVQQENDMHNPVLEAHS